MFKKELTNFDCDHNSRTPHGYIWHQTDEQPDLTLPTNSLLVLYALVETLNGSSSVRFECSVIDVVRFVTDSTNQKSVASYFCNPNITNDPHSLMACDDVIWLVIRGTLQCAQLI